MMNHLLTVERFSLKQDWTLSKYYFKGQLFGFGVEDEKRVVKVHGETCIPDGIYELGHRVSPKFSETFYCGSDLKLIEKKMITGTTLKPHEMIWVKNVPNFEFILWHWGNTDDDSHGCYIVGSKIGIINGQEGVLDSKTNYKKLYPLVMAEILKGGQKVEYKTIK